MWSDIVIHLGQFPNAVLTGKDREGYPFSIRCKPQVDEGRQVLHIPPFEQGFIQEGPAGLLYHSHNEALWDLKAVQILGRLQQAEGKWVFYPERFIAGAGLQGPVDQMRQLFKARADAKRYLEKRGLPRPKVRWDEIEELKAEIKNSKG
jgi:hypothetical protein